MFDTVFRWLETKLDKNVSLVTPFLIVLVYSAIIGLGMGLTLQWVSSTSENMGPLVRAFGWVISALAAAGQITAWAIGVWLIHTTALLLGGDVRGEARQLMAFSGYCYLPLVVLTLVHVISTLVSLHNYIIPQNPDELVSVMLEIQTIPWIIVTKSLSQAAWLAVLAGQSFAVYRIYKMSWMRSIASVVIPTALGWGVSTWVGHMLQV